MDIKHVETLIRFGFMPAHFIKRSAWVKISRVMEYLANKGEVKRVEGDIKYDYPTKVDELIITRLAEMYIHSPFFEHMDEMRKLSAQTGIPMNSPKLLNIYMNL